MGGGDNKIDFEEDKRMKFETSKEVNITSTFDGMGIREDLLRGLYAYGFEKPSAIQQRAVLPITSGRDVIAQAVEEQGILGVLTPMLIPGKTAMKGVDSTAAKSHELTIPIKSRAPRKRTL